MLTKNELDHIAELLGKASDSFGNHGCNDYSVPNTDENWEMWEKMEAKNVSLSVEEWRKHKDYNPRPTDEELYLYDWWVMSYLADRAAEESNAR